MCPLYIAGLIGPGQRKSVQPVAYRLGLGSHDGLHHFVSAGVWDAAPLEAELLDQADRLVGGPDAVLVVGDTALPKKGVASVGVAPHYASALGKNANRQTLVSLTLAQGEVPVPVGLRLFLPETWTSDPARLDKAGVPEEHRAARTKPEIALTEIDRVIAAGVHLHAVLADAGYGLSAPFRQGLSARPRPSAVGVADITPLRRLRRRLLRRRIAERRWDRATRDGSATGCFARATDLRSAWGSPRGDGGGHSAPPEGLPGGRGADLSRGRSQPSASAAHS